MHHLLHSAADILLAWSAICAGIGAIPGFFIGRMSKRRSRG